MVIGSSFILVVIVIVTAVVVPLVIYPDVNSTASSAAVEELKVEARHSSSLPPIALQLVDVSGPDEAPSSATLKWRTLFGISYGETKLSETSSTSSVDSGIFFGVWLFFLCFIAVVMVVTFRVVTRRQDNGS